MISLSTIVAVDAFTAENGGTEVIPGSHTWNDEQIAGDYLTGNLRGGPRFCRPAARAIGTRWSWPAGACLVFAGTLLHRGGRNHSSRCPARILQPVL